MTTWGKKQGEDWEYTGSSFVVMEQFCILIMVVVFTHTQTHVHRPPISSQES